ncbi:MAG: hypothetical protein HUJ62_08395 [Streptococcus gallolyticus]|nr:hypothetical protein [Streptococcus gallolyticus]
MYEAIRNFSGHSDEKCSELSAEKLESLNMARLAFFANLREDIEFLRDLITIAESPEMYKMIEDRLDRPGYDYILSKNR